jgi:MFS transporter, DHA2 family, multidrug resistance protein
MLSSWLHLRDRLVERYPQLDPAGPAYRWLVLASVMVATFMAVLDATIVNVALPNMMASFGVSVDHAEWIITAYLLVFGVMLPSSGWMADRFGSKRMFLLGLLLFTGGSFLCSLAWTVDVLVVFRVVQGAGAGFLMPIGMAIITREFPPEKRGVALGFWSVAASASVSLGPTMGGYLIDRFSWHTIFDINVPVGLLGMGAAFIILRERRADRMGPFDVMGFVSLATGLTALLLALASGNTAWNTGGWSSTFILACFAVAAVGLALFFVAELHVPHPLIEIGLFRDRNFALSNLVLFIFGVGMFGSNFLLPLYLQDSLGYTPFQAGLVFLPVGLLLGITAPLAGLFADRFDARVPVFVGLALLAYTLWRFSFLSLWSEHATIMQPLYVRGVAMGLLFSPLTAIAISGIPNRKMAQASGLVNVIRQIGGSFGVAVFGALLTRRALFHAELYGQQLDPHSAPFTRAATALRYFAGHAGGTAEMARQRAQALIVGSARQQAFVRAVDDVFLAAAVTLLVAMPLVLFLRGGGRRGRATAPAGRRGSRT